MTLAQQIQFQGSVLVTLRWADFKTIVASKSLLIQYITQSDAYMVFAIDTPITYNCLLVFTSLSSSFPFPPDYSQSQNDIDTNDFINNYQTSANNLINPIATQSLVSNAAITANGSQTIFRIFSAAQQLNLIVNVSGSISGTTPTLQYSIQELDPGNNTTTFGNIASTPIITSSGVYTAILTTTTSSALKITWTVGGTSPSFGGVYVTVVSKSIPNTTTTSNTNGFSYGTITTSAITNVAMRATTYNEQTTNSTRSISSSSANDTSAGTGARTLLLTYYDATGAGPFSETITLNGTTAVATANNNICFIEKMSIATVGSTGSNVGIITLFVNNSGGGGTIGTIAANDNQTLWAHHYVSSTKTCYITSMTGNNNHASHISVFSIKAKNPTSTIAPELLISDTLINGGYLSQTERIFGTPIKIVGPSRIIMYSSPTGTPSIINRGSFDFYEQ